MNEAEKLATAINKALPKVKSGTLRFWGDWFGRPYDNVHTVVCCENDGNLVKLRFDWDEMLSIWNPQDFKINSSTFSIKDADKIRWEWFSYGEPKIESNLYFFEYTKTADKISAITNVDWYKPDLKPTIAYSAVEILSILLDSK